MRVISHLGISKTRNALPAGTTVYYQPAGWNRSGPNLNGWGTETVAVIHRERWEFFRRLVTGPEPLGVSHLPGWTSREGITAQNVMMSYGYVLARAAQHKDCVRILDWGGGIGHYYLYSRALLPDTTLTYHCYDVPKLCRVGSELQPEVRFHAGNDTAAGAQFDLVLCSGALLYFPDWRGVVSILAQRTSGFLYITNVMTVKTAASFVVRQRSNHYETEFQAWCFNRAELLDCVTEFGMALEREFVFAERWTVEDGPEQPTCRGFLFRPLNRTAQHLAPLDGPESGMSH